jgi:hypothetical protein
MKLLPGEDLDIHVGGGCRDSSDLSNDGRGAFWIELRLELADLVNDVVHLYKK